MLRRDRLGSSRASTKEQTRGVQSLEVKTKLRILWNTGSSRQVCRRTSTRWELSKLRTERDCRASYAMPIGQDYWKQTKSLEEWLHKDNKTEPELMYWIPKYIRMRGTTQFAEIGDISATMQHIAESQDKIGWRHFTEGCISKKFHRRQRFFLQMSSNRLNGTDYAFNRYEVVILAPHVADVSPTCRRHR